MLTMREIEPHDVHPRTHHLPEDAFLVRRRAECAYDLCFRHRETFQLACNKKDFGRATAFVDLQCHVSPNHAEILSARRLVRTSVFLQCQQLHGDFDDLSSRDEHNDLAGLTIRKLTFQNKAPDHSEPEIIHPPGRPPAKVTAVSYPGLLSYQCGFDGLQNFLRIRRGSWLETLEHGAFPSDQKLAEIPFHIAGEL